MSDGTVDSELMKLVQQLINSGTIIIKIPRSLVASASNEALESAQQLAKLTGVTIEVQCDK